MKKTAVFILSISLLPLHNSLSQSFWQLTNGPYRDPVRTLAVDGSEHIFAGTPLRGVYRSTDYGGHWAAVNNGLTFPTSASIVVTTHRGMIFAKCLDYIYRSTDNGDSWARVVSAPASVLTLAAHPNGDIYVGTEYVGLFRSTDDGDTWVSTGPVSGNVPTVAINAAGSVAVAIAPSTGPWGGILLTTDNGGNWNRIYTNWTNRTLSSMTLNSLSHVFVGATGGVMRTTDYGSTWTETAFGSGSDVVALAAKPDDQLLAGTDHGLFLSGNNGDGWMTISPDTGATRAIVVNDIGRIFVSTSAGLFHSITNGAEWSRMSDSIGRTPIISVATNAMGYIYAGPYDLAWQGVGTLRSTDNGNTWVETASSGMTSRINSPFFVNLNGTVFVGTWGGVFRSDDNGEHWRNVYTDASVFYSTAMAPNGHIFTVNYDISRSTDDGATWVSIHNNIPGGTLLKSVAVNSSGYLFVGTYNGIFRSSNEGQTWSTCNNGITHPLVDVLATNASGEVFAGSWWYSSGTRVFRSANNGTHWDSLYAGVSGIEAMVFNSAGHMFVGMEGGGVIRSTNAGSSWEKLNAGLTDTNVYSLSVSPTGHLFAATYAGIFQSIESTTGVAGGSGGLPPSFALEQNYPNPFNPTTRIGFQVTGWCCSGCLTSLAGRSRRWSTKSSSRVPTRCSGMRRGWQPECISIDCRQGAILKPGNLWC